MDGIDLKQLLQANSDVAPSGDDLSYDPLFGEMERAAQGKEEQQLGDILIAAEDPNWGELKSHALAVLTRSKDLRAAVQLTRALVHLDGYRGLAEGLKLILGYVEHFWDSLHPQLDSDDHNDPTIRLNTLLNLCDAVDFLAPVSRLPLISSPRMGELCYRDIQLASGDISTGSGEQKTMAQDEVEAAFGDAGLEQLSQMRKFVADAIANLENICQIVNQRVGAERLFDLQPLSNQLQGTERQLSQRLSSVQLTEMDYAEERGAIPFVPEESAAGVSSAVIRNRDDVVRAIERICLYYERHEPSSPVPLLLQRAKRLVSMDFHEIVRDLAPEGRSHFDFLWHQDDGE